MKVRDLANRAEDQSVISKFKIEVCRTVNYGTHGPNYNTKAVWKEEKWTLINEVEEKVNAAI